MSKTIVSSDGQATKKRRTPKALPRFERLTEQEAPVPVSAMAAEFGFELAGPAAPVVVDTLQPAEPVNYQVRIEPQKLTKKIAIVGKAPSTIPIAPWNDPEWEIWGLSDLILHPNCTRWSRWFELHDPEGWHPDDSCPRRKKWHPKYWELLTKQHEGRIVYVGEPHPEMPFAERFPHERLVEKFSLRDENDQPKPYFTNTVSWLIAFAIDQGATHISVFGVDMAQQEKGVKSEYAYQRPSCEYFLGIAHGLGIKAFVPKDSDLMKAVRMYGIDRLSSNVRHAHRKRSKDLRNMKQQIEQELAQLDQQRQQKRDRLHVILGALDDTDQWWGQQAL